MKTSFSAAALLAASLAFATSASAHQIDRNPTASAPTSQSFNAASFAQGRPADRDGRFVVASVGDTTGGPSGAPNQNGG